MKRFENLSNIETQRIQRRLQREAIMRLLRENLLPLNAVNSVRGNQSQKGNSKRNGTHDAA
jgi:hypothetical protein